MGGDISINGINQIQPLQYLPLITDNINYWLAMIISLDLYFSIIYRIIDDLYVTKKLSFCNGYHRKYNRRKRTSIQPFQIHQLVPRNKTSFDKRNFLCSFSNDNSNEDNNLIHLWKQRVYFWASILVKKIVLKYSWIIVPKISVVFRLERHFVWIFISVFLFCHDTKGFV